MAPVGVSVRFVGEAEWRHFETQAAASEACSISASSISALLNGKASTALMARFPEVRRRDSAETPAKKQKKTTAKEERPVEEEEKSVVSYERGAVLMLAVVTAAVLVESKLSAHKEQDMERSEHYFAGLLWSALALVGNTAAALLRKRLSNTVKKPALQIGVAALVQGLFALLFCYSNGLLSAVSWSFVVPAVASSVLNSVTKVLETKAYATTQVSLCAPFLAFDPVMQFLVPAVLAPAGCALTGNGLACAEAAKVAAFPAYHPLAVLCVAAGAFLLARSATSTTSSLLPLGARYILFNCVVYAFTSRLDKLAILAQGKTLYFAYGRVLIAGTCLAGARPSREDWRALVLPKTAALLGLVCLAEAVYMLALYQAFAAISPVYVTAIKRGGGVLLNSAASIVLFSEPTDGKILPILVIVGGTVALCL